METKCHRCKSVVSITQTVNSSDKPYYKREGVKAKCGECGWRYDASIMETFPDE